nr:MAG TPA: hypothetical protein [Caudoviricetes sp.]
MVRNLMVSIKRNLTSQFFAWLLPFSSVLFCFKLL